MGTRKNGMEANPRKQLTCNGEKVCARCFMLTSITANAATDISIMRIPFLTALDIY